MSSVKRAGQSPPHSPERVRADPGERRLAVAQSRVAALVLALVTLLVYLPVRQHGFIDFDDPEYITENRMVTAGLTWPGVKWAFTSTDASMWLPLARLSHMIDVELFGLDAGAHHLVSALFHAANAGLLLALLFRLTGAFWPSAIIAALFAWHPLRVESVAWAAERKDVLSAFFFMLTLWAYAKYAQKPQIPNLKSPTPNPKSQSNSKSEISNLKSEISNPKAMIWYWGAVVLFLLGLLSKPMLVTVPLVLLLLDYWPLKRIKLESVSLREVGALIWEKLPYFVLSAAASVITILAARTDSVSLAHYPFTWRLANALVSYMRYLGKAFWPTHLAVLYPLPGAWPEPVVVSAVVVLGLLSWVAWNFRRTRPYLLMGWLWFVGTLLPVSGLVQVGRQAMADRFTYIPLIGVFVAVVFEAHYWCKRWRLHAAIVAPVVGVVLLACLVATVHQLAYWVDSETLFNHTLAVTRNNGIAHLNLGVALEESGHPTEALKEYREAARLEPDLAQVHNNLGNLLRSQGQIADALAQYREGLRLNPKAPLVHDNIGTMLVQLGQYSEGMRQYAEAAKLAPDDPRTHFLMAKAWLQQERPQEAIAEFRRALDLDPSDLQPLVFLARVRAAYPDRTFRNAAEAVALAERANTLSEGARPLVLDTLAMAYAEAGRFAEAQQAQQQAIARAMAAGETNALAELQPRLRLYQSGQPYRDSFTNAITGSQK